MWPQLLIQGGRMAMQALPYITATMGALPGLKEGNLGKAVLGGGLGYLGGGLGAGKLGGAQRAATTGLREAAAGAGPIAGLAGGLKPLAQLGIPLAGAAVAAPLIGGLASAAGGGAANIAGAAIPKAVQGYGALTGGGTNIPQTPQVAALPENIQQLNRPFNLLDVYTGAGLTSKALQEQQQDINIDWLNKEYAAMFPKTEKAKKNEMERLMAAAQIRQNIATAANLIDRAQATAATQGVNAANQLGAALSAQYQYS